jgi:dTDP-4-amino-4,6-dideoxygalactose transaminase
MEIPLFKVFMSPAAGEAVNKTLYSGYIGQGQAVEEFESRLAEYLGTPWIVTVNSGTAALQLALHLIDNSGDEVITTPLTCFATTASILANNLRPKWADVSLASYNIDPDAVRAKLSDRTKAIIAVHLGGYPADLDRLSIIQGQFEREYGYRPPVIEDAAHAFGAEFEGRKLGNHGNIVCYSFQAIKTLTCGDGGLLVLPNRELYERARRLRWFGLDRENRSAPIVESGFKYHMNDIQATIGLANLDHVDELLAIQRDNWRYYNNALSHMRVRTEDRDCTGWTYPLRVYRKNNFERTLASHGIATGIGHYRNDKHPCVAKYRHSLPNMDVLENELTCIPCGWWVGPEERQFIVDIIARGW